MSKLKWALLICLVLICLISGAPSLSLSADGTGVNGTLPLNVYDVQSSEITSTGATVSWTTNGGATSQVVYDTVSHSTATGYAYQSTLDASPVPQHTVTLNTLLPSTTYYYRVTSTTVITGNTFSPVSSESFFTTTASTTSTTTATTTTTEPAGGGGGGGGGGKEETTTTTTATSTTTTTSSTTTTSTPTTPVTGVGSVNLSGIIDKNGVLQQTIILRSLDGVATLIIAAGTRCTLGSLPLTEVTVAIDDSPLKLSEGSVIISAAYDFRPNGAVFDPPATMTLSYNPAIIPAGVLETDSTLAFYDTYKEQWVDISDCVVDTNNHAVSAAVSHFTLFAVTVPANVISVTTNTITTPPANTTMASAGCGTSDILSGPAIVQTSGV